MQRETRVERAERIVRQHLEDVEMLVLAVLALTVDAPGGCPGPDFRSRHFRDPWFVRSHLYHVSKTTF